MVGLHPRSRFVGLNRTLGTTKLIRDNIRTGSMVRGKLILMGKRVSAEHKEGLCPNSATSFSKGRVGVRGWLGGI